jgi:hypothetical protein
MKGRSLVYYTQKVERKRAIINYELLSFYGIQLKNEKRDILFLYKLENFSILPKVEMEEK